MATITHRIAEWACDLAFEHLTAEAIEAAKRHLYDTLGCALGGYPTPVVQLFLEHYRELGQPGPCTVIGAGERMNPIAAGMLNALMVRALDCNDIYRRQDEVRPSDLAAAPLAICEMKQLGGRELLLGLVLGWEITMRLSHIGVPGISARGWHSATLMAFAAPVVAGRMLGLTAEQMQHAIGICACHRFTLGCVEAGARTTMGSAVSPLATRDGIEAALLAQRGCTGPESVIEGTGGLEKCLGESWDHSWITDNLGDRFMITDCGMRGAPPTNELRDVMTMDELDEKFNGLAGSVMNERRRNELKEAIFGLESCADVGELMQLTIADGHGGGIEATGTKGAHG